MVKAIQSLNPPPPFIKRGWTFPKLTEMVGYNFFSRKGEGSLTWGCFWNGGAPRVETLVCWLLNVVAKWSPPYLIKLLLEVCKIAYIRQLQDLWWRRKTRALYGKIVAWSLHKWLNLEISKSAYCRCSVAVIFWSWLHIILTLYVLELILGFTHGNERTLTDFKGVKMLSFRFLVSTICLIIDPYGI